MVIENRTRHFSLAGILVLALLAACTLLAAALHSPALGASGVAGALAHSAEWAWIRDRAHERDPTPPRLLDGFPETLAFLARRHRLILFTKGEPVEQGAKIERSGLVSYFEAVEIAAEKDAANYERVVNRHKIVKQNAWMVGNSPKSDVNPALEAGLNVVFIPHRMTWELEHDELVSGLGRMLLLTSFRDLRLHF